MADLIFYTNPQSRGRIVRWMLEEVGQPYDTEVIAYDQMKSERYLAINPMGKVPAIKHNGHVVTECAAICAYLADVFPEAVTRAPRDDEKADYYRWLFYAAGPIEAAISNQAMNWQVPPGARADVRLRQFRQGRSPCSTSCFSLRDYVCGDRFTAADVYVGSQIMFPHAVRNASRARQLPSLSRPAAGARRLQARQRDRREDHRRNAGPAADHRDSKPARLGPFRGRWSIMAPTSAARHSPRTVTAGFTRLRSDRFRPMPSGSTICSATYGNGPKTAGTRITEGTPRDGSAWIKGGDCSTRIVRGGGWFSPLDELRSAVRAADPADFRKNDIGFRVARGF